MYTFKRGKNCIFLKTILKCDSCTQESKFSLTPAWSDAHCASSTGNSEVGMNTTLFYEQVKIFCYDQSIKLSTTFSLQALRRTAVESVISGTATKKVISKLQKNYTS